MWHTQPSATPVERCWELSLSFVPCLTKVTFTHRRLGFTADAQVDLLEMEKKIIAKYEDEKGPVQLCRLWQHHWLQKKLLLGNYSYDLEHPAPKTLYVLTDLKEHPTNEICF